MACEWPVYSHLSEANELWHIQSVTACKRPRISCTRGQLLVHTDIVLTCAFYSLWSCSGLCRAAILPYMPALGNNYADYWLIHIEVPNIVLNVSSPSSSYPKGSEDQSPS